MWQIFDITINFFQAILMTYYINRRCLLRKHSFYYDIALIFCICTVITLLDCVQIYYLDNLVFLVPFLFSICFRKCRVVDLLFWCLLLCIVFSLDSTLASGLVYALAGAKWEDLLSNDSYRFFYIISANLLHTVLIVLICNIHRNNHSTSYSVIFFFLLSLLAQFSSAECFFASQIHIIDQTYYATYGSIGLLFSMIFTIVLYELILKETELRRKLELEMQTTRLINSHQEELRTIYSNMLSTQHDLRHRITAAEEILAHNKDSYQDAIDMLQSTSVLNEYITGNIGTDAVLAAKTAVMNDNNIHFSFNPCPLSNLPLPERDFIILLANMLDNAIEAVMRIPFSVSDREIYLSFSRTWNIFSICCINSIDPKTIHQKDDMFISSKEHPELHGYGIRSIQKIVEAAGGLSEFTSDNECFYVKIILPMED